MDAPSPSANRCEDHGAARDSCAGRRRRQLRDNGRGAECADRRGTLCHPAAQEWRAPAAFPNYPGAQPGDGDTGEIVCPGDDRSRCHYNLHNQSGQHNLRRRQYLLDRQTARAAAAGRQQRGERHRARQLGILQRPAARGCAAGCARSRWRGHLARRLSTALGLWRRPDPRRRR